MIKPLLILDCPYLCYRAYFVHQALSYGGEPTGVIFGLLRELIALKQRFDSRRFVFCFDHGKGLREKEFPEYKSTRRVCKPDEERVDIRPAVKELKLQHLYDLGFNNVCYQKGYEADDIIASIVQNLKPEQDAIIVSADKDLYQLLSHRVRIWKPQTKQLYTEKDLAREYFGLSPQQWHCVKAIAGCSSDNIPGVQGVGEITAAKFLRGMIQEGSKMHQRILDNEEVWKRNLPLVRLPYPGTICPERVKDEFSPDRWRTFCQRFGMKSLVWRT